MSEERYLTIAQACAALQVSRRTLERRIETGQLPVLRVGRLIRIRPADLEAAFTMASAGKPAGVAPRRRRPSRGK